MNKALEPYWKELSEIEEGYFSIAIHRGVPDLVTTHKTNKVKR